MNRAWKAILGLAALLTVALVAAGPAAAKDRNHDRIPDRWEKKNDLSLKVKQTRRDQDHDGLQNLGEFKADTDPHATDSDDDGVEDGDEDGDRDDVDNNNEQAEHTDPGDDDSDNDQTEDGDEDRDHDGLDNADEDASGNDPVDPDTDDDTVEDGDEGAGTIASFDGTTLVIDLPDGGSVSGTVDENTEIECETEDEHEHGDESGDDDGEDINRLARDGGHSGEDSNDLDEDEHGDEDNVCTTADLLPGTIVHEAELEGGTVFEEIELVR